MKAIATIKIDDEERIRVEASYEGVISEDELLRDLGYAVVKEIEKLKKTHEEERS